MLQLSSMIQMPSRDQIQYVQQKQVVWFQQADDIYQVWISWKPQQKQSLCSASATEQTFGDGFIRMFDWPTCDRGIQRNDDLTRSTISSSRWRSFFKEPVEFSSLRKTMGDSGLLAIERPCISDNSAFAQHILNRKWVRPATS